MVPLQSQGDLYGEAKRALELQTASLQAFQRLGNWQDAAYALEGSALAHFAASNWERSMEFLRVVNVCELRSGLRLLARRCEQRGNVWILYAQSSVRKRLLVSAMMESAKHSIPKMETTGAPSSERKSREG